MAKRKGAKLPKGLAEFEASLHDLEYAGRLLPRLKDLPKNGYGESIDEFFSIYMKKVEEAELAAMHAREAARASAVRIWKNAKLSYTHKQLQEATGYDDD